LDVRERVDFISYFSVAVPNFSRKCDERIASFAFLPGPAHASTADSKGLKAVFLAARMVSPKKQPKYRYGWRDYLAQHSRRLAEYRHQASLTLEK
jgi:hypothetical protein